MEITLAVNVSLFRCIVYSVNPLRIKRHEKREQCIYIKPSRIYRVARYLRPCVRECDNERKDLTPFALR